MSTTQDDLLASLLSAADATQQAYNAAQAANPGADLSKLYLAEINAQKLYFDALSRQFQPSPELDDINDHLKGTTKAVKDSLQSLTSVTKWISLVNKLVQAATSAAALFA